MCIPFLKEGRDIGKGEIASGDSQTRRFRATEKAGKRDILEKRKRYLFTEKKKVTK